MILQSSTQSFWEVTDEGLSINPERYQEISKGLEVKHYNKLKWNHPILLKIIELNQKYSMRKVITKLEIYYWKHNSFKEFIENIERKVNSNITDIDIIIL